MTEDDYAGETGAAAETCLHLDPETRKEAVRRLKGAYGHLAGVLRMLENPGCVLRRCDEAA